jgi:bifunctional pyridoxal-dependent enzyme with beta-cystathionase and maltose regulon repressor activities
MKIPTRNFRKAATILFAVIVFALCANFSTQLSAQSAYLDMTIVESTDYNRPIGVFSYDEFQGMFKITTSDNETYNEDITRSLILFLKILEPQKSYVIQHEPTYYFIYQYNKKQGNYLVMNNSIGESNEAIYVDSFEEAQKEMLNLLLIFYSNTPAFSVTEYQK